jgi:hypothetical protein
MNHFLDEGGKIPKKMPKEARELASFLALVIDETTNEFSLEPISTNIRCFQKRCEGLIQSEFLKESDEIHWLCSKCQNEGRISGWQKTQWDNR